MNLRRRGVATDVPTVALDIAAAGRFLAGAGIPGGRIWIAEEVAPSDQETAWARGVAVVQVRGDAARAAALATAHAFGLAATTDGPGAATPPTREDGERLAARFEVGLEPDEIVELVLGAAALRALGARLAALDAAVLADTTPRRLVLAGLPDHSPALTPELVDAIVHPGVLVESEPSGTAFLDLLRVAADRVAGSEPT